MIGESALLPVAPLGLSAGTTTREIRRNLSTTYRGLDEQGPDILDVLARSLSVMHSGLAGSVAAICAQTGLSANKVREALLGLRGLTVATETVLLRARPSAVVPGLQVLIGWVQRPGATLTLPESLAELTEATAAVAAGLLRGDASSVGRNLDRIERAVRNLRSHLEAR